MEPCCWIVKLWPVIVRQRSTWILSASFVSGWVFPARCLLKPFVMQLRDCVDLSNRRFALVKLNSRCTTHLSSYVILCCYFSGSQLNTQALRSDLSRICQTRLITAGRGGTTKQRHVGLAPICRCSSASAFSVSQLKKKRFLLTYYKDA